MDGGLDAHYVDFGRHREQRLRQLIEDQHHGEFLVGAAEIVETGSPRHPYLIAAPTMRVPMILDERTVNPYLATRAELLHARRVSHIRSIAFPGMGTGIGRVSSMVCARQMRAAIEEVLLNSRRIPATWTEASERHQLLYTDRPIRLRH